MTKLLEKAFDAASKLPKKEQEAFAAFMIEELASERRWAESFARSQDKLASMADDAIAEYRAGKTHPFEQDSDLTHD